LELAQAYAILGLNPEKNYQDDTILDTCEDAVFKEVTFFARRAFLPKLAKKRIERLKDIDTAAQLLKVNFESRHQEYIPKEKFKEIDNLLSLLFAYHSEESRLKTYLVNVSNPSLASNIYGDWIMLFEHFSVLYIQIFEEVANPGELDSSGIKVTEIIDYNNLLQELKNDEYGGLASREYFRLKKLRS